VVGYVPAMLNPVNQNGLIVFGDLVDDAIVAASCGSETFEFAYERYPDPGRVVGDWPENGFQGCQSHLVRKTVEVT
jgi:hypothetical protein